MPQKNSNIESIHSKNGKTYWVECGDTLYIRRLQAGQYQASNWLFAQTLLQNTRTAIDVGSNNAVNAVHYAEVFDWVECFEPTGLAQQLWHNTIRDNGVANVTLHTEAVGETNMTSEILLHERNGGHNHLAHYDKNPRARPERSSKQTESVAVATLDSKNFQTVDFLKIDVEGYELYVLKGADATIDSCRPVCQLEMVERQCRKFGYKPDDILDWFRERAYRCCSKRRGWIEGGWSKGKADMDLFFVPEEFGTVLEPRLELFQEQ